MHPSFWSCARARSVRRTGPALAALYRVRGVADLTKGVVAPVRLGPLSSHHVFLSFSILLVSFACARARTARLILPSTSCFHHRGMWRSLFLLSPSLLFFHLRFILLFSFFHSSFLPSSLSHLGLLRSYPMYCPFHSNPGCVAESKRNYSYLPPTLLDSRLFRGSRPSHYPPRFLSPPILFLLLLSSSISSLSSIFVIKLFQLM